MDDAVTSVTARAYTIPTDRPEADGTLEWDSTTMVIADVSAGGVNGLGYTYASRAVVLLIMDYLAPAITGVSASDIAAAMRRMQRATRNLGVTGQVAYAISAIDTALWDLKARLLGVSLAELMGTTKRAMPVYGSGGFTTYDEKAITSQIAAWRDNGITMVKIKIGARPEQDPKRVATARQALDDDDKLFVDANGAYSVKQALDFSGRFADEGVSWFEEPVPSDDLKGLHFIRNRAPAGMDITAGEYGDSPLYMKRMLAAQAVDVLQIDATRCQGYSGFIQAAALAAAASIPVSSHCAPALHLPVCCHIGARHIEYFHDHCRIEKMMFDGVPPVVNGALTPDFSRPGHGLSLKRVDAEKYAA